MDFINAEPLAAANLPTFSKRGESSQTHYTTPETTPAFVPSPSEHYKGWTTLYQPSWSTSQHHQQLPLPVPGPSSDITNTQMNDWLYFDEDIEMGADLSSFCDANEQHILSEPASSSGTPSLDPGSSRRLASLPVPVSRPSIQFNPAVFQPDGSSALYPIDSEQTYYDIYGSEATFSFFDGRGHIPLEPDSLSKPSQFYPPSTGRPILPPLSSISDFPAAQYSGPTISSTSFSPISPWSALSSPSSSPASSPELVIQTSIPLHQPRPQRRIPIISLSALASACEDSLKAIDPDQRRLREQPPQDLLSPLTLESPMIHDAPTCFPSRLRTADQFLEREGDRWKGTIACACGCNAAYTLS